MTTHSATINGLKLVYEKEGSGPPLVFLPRRRGQRRPVAARHPVLPFRVHLLRSRTARPGTVRLGSRWRLPVLKLHR